MNMFDESPCINCVLRMVFVRGELGLFMFYMAWRRRLKIIDENLPLAKSKTLFFFRLREHAPSPTIVKRHVFKEE